MRRECCWNFAVGENVLSSVAEFAEVFFVETEVVADFVKECDSDLFEEGGIFGCEIGGCGEGCGIVNMSC